MKFIQLALACAVPILALVACTSEPAPNVLLVTIDTLRPDSLGFIGGRNETPVIDELALSGHAFTGAISPVPLTLPAHTSILSGKLPHRHGVHDNGQTVPTDLPLLQETLRKHGYRTAAFVSGFPLQKMFGLDRGFDHYDDVMTHGDQGWVERPAEETVAAVQTWLGAHQSDQPLFDWVHFYDPHDPYQPPREFWQPGERGAYDGEVAYTDYWLGKLIETAKAVSGSRPLLIVVTADHAEALGEHGEKTHGYFVYDSTLKVPLIFDWAGEITHAIGAEPVQTIDIAPTILALLGIDEMQDIDGISLAKGLHDGTVPLHPAYSETWLPWTYYGWAPLTAWRDGDWKFVDAPAPELYAIDRDPGEQKNVAHVNADISDRLTLALDAAKSSKIAIASGQADDAALERLRSLGYVGVGAAITEAPTGLADPKSMLDVRDALQAAEGLLRERRYVEAETLFEKVLASDPDNRFASLRSGVTLLHIGRAKDAVARLQHAVQIDPHRAEGRFALGDALMRVSDFAAAADQWAALAELQPRRAEAWFNLAEALRKSGHAARADNAMIEYERLKSESTGSSTTP
ncbi:MAG: sulfatase-like hydrolase/transferase [Dokdonella sp.]